MKDKWIQLALRLAEATAPTSTDRYHKVGCAILRKEGSVCGIGFNGQPRESTSQTTKPSTATSVAASPPTPKATP